VKVKEPDFFFFFHSEKEKENEKNYPINFCPFVDEIKRLTQKIKIKKRVAEQINELTIDCRLSLLICIAKHPTKAGAQHTKKKSQTGARSSG
jgi:hypothetical protein